MYACYVIISVLGAYVITGKLGRGTLTTGDLSSLITYGINILSVLMMLAMILIMITMSVASAKRIAEVMEEESTLTNPDNALTAVADGSVDFDNVTFKYSDKILVLDHGRIIEEGNHEELIAKRGTYYQLYTGAFELE